MKSFVFLVTICTFNYISCEASNGYQDDEENVGTFMPRENVYNNYQPSSYPYPQPIPEPYGQHYPRAYPYPYPDRGHVHHQEFEGRAFRMPSFIPIHFPPFGFFDRSKEPPSSTHQTAYPSPPSHAEPLQKGRKMKKVRKPKKIKETPIVEVDHPKTKYTTKCNCAN